jgi:hypothetical protein
MNRLELRCKVPFPVIGVPWYQMAHLPDMVSICHEIGHVVEDDLALTDNLQRVVGEGVGPARKAYWCAWQRELFPCRGQENRTRSE